MNEELRCLIESLKDLVEGLRNELNREVRRLDDLRADDREAVKVARADDRQQMAGFPAEYAKKVELEAIRDTAIRLDASALPRNEYNEKHRVLELVMEAKVDKTTYDAHLADFDRWRDEQNARTNQAIGGQVTIKRMLIAATTILGLVIPFVVLLANGKL